MSAPYWIDPQNNSSEFPPVDLALKEPDGLLALGGSLSQERLLNAYRRGIFPWYSDDQPILWWSPDPRCVLLPEQLKISRSLAKTLRKKPYTVTLDQSFFDVVRECSLPRANQTGTWITEDMLQAYFNLHRNGIAHSVEAWHNGQCVGGLYGVAIGQVFFGESMFSRMNDASKICLVYLVQQLLDWGYRLIDCQVHSAHLQSLGATSIPRKQFVQLLDRYCESGGKGGNWNAFLQDSRQQR